jgi:hypothetical protein
MLKHTKDGVGVMMTHDNLFEALVAVPHGEFPTVNGEGNPLVHLLRITSLEAQAL